MTIEDVILSRDNRGISALRGHLPQNFCDEAARFILDNKGTAIIATGFYIRSAAAPETDGPPGAIAMGKALRSLGYNVHYVTDKYSASLLKATATSGEHLVEFPISDHESSQKFAKDLINKVRPTVLISIERCGFSKNKAYLNMRNLDISEFTAKIDYLFTNQKKTVGVGDGGNEIGMGNLAQFIPQVGTLVPDPAVTPVTKLVIASVSNWGAYGLVAALSLLAKKNLLISVDEEKQLIRKIVDLGAVDGISAQRKYAVDAFELEENAKTLAELHSLLKTAGIK
ncbi:MAG: DUF4392 domain-containing protein [Chloroflexi bacterium]|nr:DUF4392 domain-containing protein [Chloroflexota bacterium]